MFTRGTCRVLVSFSLLLIGSALSRASVAGEEPKAKPKWTVYGKWPFDGAEAKRRQAETARALGVKPEQDFELAPGVKVTMVLIPAGEFMMGSGVSAREVARLAGLDADKYFENEHPQHRVTIKKPFWMAKHEVTQAQWQAVMGRNPSDFKGDKNPVEKVSWDHIQDFLKKVNARVEGGGFALATEAQWEYACRAGTGTPFHFGETISTDQVNYNGNYPYGRGRKGVYRERAMPVGSFPANAWGLHDMHGNVWEWCASPHAGRYNGSESKGAEAPANWRVLRGGSWYTFARFCRSASRSYGFPGLRGSFMGFRVCRVVVVARPLP